MMDSDDRKSLRRVSLLLIGGGALLTLAISSFSHDPAILSFGEGPAAVGVVFLVSSFFRLKEAKNPLPRWRVLALYLLPVGTSLPYLFFNYRLSPTLRPYIFIPYAIVLALLAFWPAKRHPEQGSRKAIAGGGSISN
jgi:hypothetical protein